MRIKKYWMFLEDFEMSANDTPATRMSKQAVDSDSDYLNDYKAKKDLLTKLFTEVDVKGEFKTDDVRLKEEIEKILGKEEQKDGPDRNPLLQELTIVLDLQRQLTKVQKTTNEEKSKMEATSDEATQEEGPRKDELNKRVADLNTKIKDGVSQMTDLSRRAEEAKTNFDKKMADFEKNLKQSIDQIKKTPRK